MKLNFYQTTHCRSGKHCTTCRDRVGGSEFRASIRTHFQVSGCSTDFSCPYGKPWGTKNSIIVAQPGDEKKYLGDRLGSAIGKIRNKPPCNGCKKIEAGLNGIDKAARTLHQRARTLIHVSR